MAAKRARMAPSDGEIEILLPPVQWIQQESWIDKRKPAVPRNQAKQLFEIQKLSVDSKLKEKQSRPSIFTLSTPPSEPVFGGIPVTDKCGNCVKNLGMKKTFMYSSLGFCSIECRQERIDFDDKMEKLARKSGGLKINFDLSLGLGLPG